MINKKIPMLLLLLFVGLTFVSASGLRVTSVDSSNVIRNGNLIEGEFIITTILDGAGQEILGTFSPNEMREKINDNTAPYPKDSFSVSVEVPRETAVYEVRRNVLLDIFKYTYYQYDCHKNFLGVCDGDAQICHPTNTIAEHFRESAFGYKDDRQCITKEQIGLGGEFENPSIKFNAIITVKSSSGASKQIEISSDKSSVNLGSAGSASWGASLFTGESPPDQGLYRAIKAKDSSKWNIAMANSAEGYSDTVKDMDDTAESYLMDIEEGDKTINSVKSIIENINTRGLNVLSERQSIGGDFSQNSEGELVTVLSGQVTVPQIIFYIKADWIGVIIPSGIPKIINSHSDTFSSGESGELVLEIQNIGDYKGAFSVNINDCEPFISKGTSISNRIELAPMDKDEIKIPLSSGDVSDDLEKSCSVEVYDVNDPTQKDIASIKLSMTSAKICNPKEIQAQGNIIKQCDSDGMRWTTLKNCENGVEKKGAEWTCKPKPEPKSIVEKIIPTKEPQASCQYECCEDSDCGQYNFCSRESSKCMNCQDGNCCPEGNIWCGSTNSCQTPIDCLTNVNSVCTLGWPNKQGSIILGNEPNYACDLYEVKDPSLKKIAKEAIDCCNSGCEASGCHKYCDEAVDDSGLDSIYTDNTMKKCSGLYMVYGLGPAEKWMKGYFNSEIACGRGTSGSCRGNQRYGMNAGELQCLDKGLSFPKAWSSDTDMSKNTCQFSDLPAHVNINVLSTGTCVDYSVSLTTLLRMVGYSADEVYSADAPGHWYNLVKFPGDRKFSVVDTVGNSPDPYIPGDGKLWSWESAGKEVNHCDFYEGCINDNGRIDCPSREEVYGC